MSRNLHSRPLLAIFWAGLTAGVLDISAAFITWAFRGVRPFVILQGIASGLLGPKSFKEGWPTAALGLACHFFIAFTAAAIFYGGSRIILWMTRHAVSAGVLYGIAVYIVMYWIVKPLSLVRARPFSWTETIVAIATHMICVGVPISVSVRRFSSR